MKQDERYTLNVDTGDKEIYADVGKALGPGVSNKELFMLALAIGFQNGLRREISKRDSYVRVEYLSSRDKSVIASIAFKESNDDPKAMIDPMEKYTIAEEYASGGIRYIEGLLEPSGTFALNLEKEMRSVFKEKKKQGVIPKPRQDSD